MRLALIEAANSLFHDHVKAWAHSLICDWLAKFHPAVKMPLENNGAPLTTRGK